MSKRQSPIPSDHLDRIAEKVAARVAQQVEPRYFTLEEAGQYCSKTPEAMRSLARRGRLPVIKLGGRLYMDRVDIDAVMQAGKIPIPTE